MSCNILFWFGFWWEGWLCCCCACVRWLVVLRVQFVRSYVPLVRTCVRLFVPTDATWCPHPPTVQACEFFDAESLALTLREFPDVARSPFAGACIRAYARARAGVRRVCVRRVFVCVCVRRVRACVRERVSEREGSAAYPGCWRPTSLSRPCSSCATGVEGG